MVIMNTDFVDEALLSLLMHRGYLVFKCMNELTPDMISGRSNQLVYRAMLNIAKRGFEPSPLLVKSELVKAGVFESLGGDEFLHREILNVEFNEAHISEYINYVRNNYKLRQLSSLADLIKDKVKDLSKPDDVIDKSLAYLTRLGSVGSTGSIKSVSDISEESMVGIETRRANPGSVGVSTGFSGIDSFTNGYGKGELWYIGARPSMGKTAFLLKSLYSCAKAGHPALIVNREMSNVNLVERLYSIISGVSFKKIRAGNVTDEELSKLRDAKVIVDSIPLYIECDWSGDEVSLISNIRRFIKPNGIRVVGVDYIQLLAERSDESVHELGKISRSLKLLAGESDMTVVALSQLNRKLEERQDKRPQMFDLRQAGYLEEDGDYMVGLYRDEVYRVNSPDAGKVEFIIRKARNGPIGTVNILFDGETVNMYDENDLATVW